MQMTRTFVLVKSREHGQEIEPPCEEFHKIFGLAERGALCGHVDVYIGEHQMGSIIRDEHGVWKINWYSSDVTAPEAPSPLCAAYFTLTDLSSSQRAQLIAVRPAIRQDRRHTGLICIYFLQRWGQLSNWRLSRSPKPRS